MTENLKSACKNSCWFKSYVVICVTVYRVLKKDMALFYDLSGSFIFYFKIYILIFVISFHTTN